MPASDDYEPSEQLLDEASDGLARCMEKLGRYQRFLLARGISSVFVLSSYDPLSESSNYQIEAIGNHLQNIGALKQAIEQL